MSSLYKAFITDGKLSFREEKPLWWKAGCHVRVVSNTKSMPGSFFLYKSERLNKSKGSVVIDSDGAIQVKSSDGVYDCMYHSPQSILVAPSDSKPDDTSDSAQQAKDNNKFRCPDIDLESADEYTLNLWLMKLGKNMVKTGRFSAGFSGFAAAMRDCYATVKLYRPSAAITDEARNDRKLISILEDIAKNPLEKSSERIKAQQMLEALQGKKVRETVELDIKIGDSTVKTRWDKGKK